MRALAPPSPHQVMSGTLTSDLAPISDITLALFADSGWFAPNYDVPSPECYFRREWCTALLRSGGGAGAGGGGGGDGGGGVLRASAPPSAIALPPRLPFLWGAGRGCGFVTGSCAGSPWSAPGYFCDSAAPPAGGCTLGREAVGYCTLSTYSAPLPPQFQYFKGQPNLGGNPPEDYCPRWASYSNYHCRWRARPRPARQKNKKNQPGPCEKNKPQARPVRKQNTGPAYARREAKLGQWKKKSAAWAERKYTPRPACSKNTHT